MGVIFGEYPDGQSRIPEPTRSGLSVTIEMSPMPLWRLTPTDLAADEWRASTYKGIAIVRAEDERRARRLAASAFGIATVRVYATDFPGKP